MAAGKDEKTTKPLGETEEQDVEGHNLFLGVTDPKASVRIRQAQIKEQEGKSRGLRDRLRGR